MSMQITRARLPNGSEITPDAKHPKNDRRAIEEVIIPCKLESGLLK